MSTRTERPPVRRRGLLPLLALAAIVAVGVIGPLVVAADPAAQDLSRRLLHPGADHLLGTDELGRDLLSRLLHGLRLSLASMAAALVVSLGIGIPLGLLGGLGPASVRKVVRWLADMMFSIPAVVLVLLVVGMTGRGLLPAMLGLGIAFSPIYVRLVADEAHALKDAPFVRAARVGGATRWSLVRRHIGPSLARPLTIQSAMTLRAAILTEAALSYLGFGAQPPHVSLGSMLKSAQNVVLDAPWQVLPPGLTLFVIVLALNSLADGWTGGLQRRSGYAHLLVRSRHRRAGAPRAAEEPGAATAVRLDRLDADLTGGPERVPIVEGLSLEVAAGEIVAIVGESGSGKSMTAMAVAGILPAGIEADPARIVVGGTPLVDLDEAGRRTHLARELGVVFQDPISCLDPMRTVGTSLAAPLRVLRGLSRAEARERVRAALVDAGVADVDAVIDRYPHQLSGGIAQRVMIANALIAEPRVLIADEATSALDATVQLRVLSLLRRLCDERGLAVLLITHDMGVVSAVADRVLVLYAGRAMEQGDAAEVLARPGHPYTRALKEAVLGPEHAGRPLPVVPGSTPQPGARPPGCPFAPRCARATQRCAEPVPTLTLGPAHTVSCVHPHTEPVPSSTTLPDPDSQGAGLP
ncbi:dipeptide/oligopeptide/nickel ABC transporter permease/ATP-binding protein [Nocardioides sp. L-11A]|uniref:dipeptide/oligopeptide/nickel ABC transporter permease/ATP-binding protein n=1 Tax=Nocardioides sp. L-11A TaxID=3043848 RepID=UPI002499D8CB|nr:dipeptide/oligopeptide/nickel ABC transporter permease/ATP-binding protein [Nocardioides sp. L-11A]